MKACSWLIVFLPSSTVVLQHTASKKYPPPYTQTSHSDQVSYRVLYSAEQQLNLKSAFQVAEWEKIQRWILKRINVYISAFQRKYVVFMATKQL